MELLTGKYFDGLRLPEPVAAFPDPNRMRVVGFLGQLVQLT
jgi:hypothetical protein